MSRFYDSEIDLSDDNDAHTKEILLIGEGKRVIDFGCSTGAVAAALKERGCEVTGVELYAEAAGRAREFCDRVVVGDLGEMDLAKELGPGPYDVGLFGDVIEHLKNPGRVLTQTRGLLGPGGFIVLSVPNIAHASIRMMLLRGDFSYEEMGILDDTHLKYFTRGSLTDLVESCGYLVDVMDWTEVPVLEDELRRVLDPLGLSNLMEVVKAFSEWEALAFQWVVKAVPADEPGLLSSLSEKKVQAERRVKTLESENANMRRHLEYSAGVEKQVEKKNVYIAQLETALAERDEGVQQKEQLIEGLKARIAELEDAPRHMRGRTPRSR